MVPWTKTYQFLWLLILWGQQPVLGAVFPGTHSSPQRAPPSHLALPPGGPPPTLALRHGVSGKGSR